MTHVVVVPDNIRELASIAAVAAKVHRRLEVIVMAIASSDYLNVSKRMAELGCRYPRGLAFLPVNFESASSIAEFRQVSEAATVKKLFRGAGLPHDEIVEQAQKPPYVQNNSFEWVAPTIFVSAALISENPHCVAIALSLIANYATDFFRGIGGRKSVKLDVVVERTSTKTCTRISYEGDADGLKSLSEVVQNAAHE